MFQYVRNQSLEYFIALCLFTECVATLVTKSSHSESQIITTLAIPQLLLYFGRSDQGLLPESLWLPPKLPACFFNITSLQSIFNKTVRLLLLQSMCGHVPPRLTYIFHSKSQSPCKNLKHQGLFAPFCSLSCSLPCSLCSVTLVFRCLKHVKHSPASSLLNLFFSLFEWPPDTLIVDYFIPLRFAFICQFSRRPALGTLCALSIIFSCSIFVFCYFAVKIWQ